MTASFPTGQGLHTDASTRILKAKMAAKWCLGENMIVAAEGNAYIRSQIIQIIKHKTKTRKSYKNIRQTIILSRQFNKSIIISIII